MLTANGLLVAFTWTSKQDKTLKDKIFFSKAKIFLLVDPPSKNSRNSTCLKSFMYKRGQKRVHQIEIVDL